MSASYRRILCPAVLTTAAFLAFWGCATIQVDSIQEQSADFSSLQDFAFLAAPPVPSADPRVNAITLRLVEKSVREALLQRGFAEAAEADADFLVTTYAAIEREIDVGSYGWSPYIHYPGSWGLYWEGYPIREYPKGTLIVDITIAQNRVLVWRGWAETRGSDLTDPAKVREAATKVLALFPPR